MIPNSMTDTFFMHKIEYSPRIKRNTIGYIQLDEYFNHEIDRQMKSEMNSTVKPIYINFKNRNN